MIQAWQYTNPLNKVEQFNRPTKLENW